MAIDPVSAVAAQSSGAKVGGARIVELAPSGGAGAGSPQLEARFHQSLARVGGIEGLTPTGSVPAPIKGLFGALDQVNVQAKAVSEYAASAEASGGQLTPGEIVQLTMKCQEFMFQAQLTSNIANRSSDGVQQLFKQQ
jgi:hypothetical protein